MASRVRLLTVACSMALLAALGGTAARAQAPPSSQDLRLWLQQFPAAGTQLREVVVARQLVASEDMRPFSGETIVGLGISGHVQFASSRGLVRVLMVDEQSHERLVYETYSLLASEDSFNIENACRETCLQSASVPSSLKVELVDASLEIRTIVLNQVIAREGAPTLGVAPTTEQFQAVKDAQEREIVAALNRRIKAKGLGWIAGETEISRLPYTDKRALIACATDDLDTPLNLQGAEYYTGGILEVSTGDRFSYSIGVASAMVPSFDWRARHGANKPGSPYYDGDPTGGGWLTSVKNQACADCWAHSALGATEALVNVYFNQHVDVDLSEQELVSCSGAGTCRYGGNTGAALSYVQRTGVVDEGCFPESGADEPCGNCCKDPRERIMIAGFDDISPSYGADYIKRKLIASGPLPFGIRSWWHAMVLAGYETDRFDGATIWILKNSWGSSWGENGYGRLKVPLADVYLTYNLRTPLVSMVTPRTVVCRDADGDGYFNWGVGDSAWACIGEVPRVEDCDDSDPTLAVLTEDGYCTAPPDTIAPIVTAAATPSAAWPPNGKRVAVVISGSITDIGSGVDPDTARYSVNDEYGEVDPSGHVRLASDGTYTFTVSMPASRHGQDRDGREYVITVSAEDRVGNPGSASATVKIPHDMSGRTKH